MTADEVQRRIGYLLEQIVALQQENISLKKNIEDLEEGGTAASSLVDKWETKLSDCFSTVRTNLSKADPNSGFSLYYLERINAILSSKEAVEIGDCFSTIKSNVIQKIGEFEDKIKRNNCRIYQFQNEVSELKALQFVGDE